MRSDGVYARYMQCVSHLSTMSYGDSDGNGDSDCDRFWFFFLTQNKLPYPTHHLPLTSVARPRDFRGIAVGTTSYRVTHERSVSYCRCNSKP